MSMVSRDWPSCRCSLVGTVETWVWESDSGRNRIVVERPRRGPSRAVAADGWQEMGKPVTADTVTAAARLAAEAAGFAAMPSDVR